MNQRCLWRGALALALAAGIASARAADHLDADGTPVAPVAALAPNVAGSLNIPTVSSSNTTVSLPANAVAYPSLLIENRGAMDAYVVNGGSAATTGGILIGAGEKRCIHTQGLSQLGAITASSTTSLQITQANICVPAASAATSGTFSATVSGFAPGAAYATLAVTTSSARVAMPSGTTVVVYNTGAVAAYAKLGNTSVTAATSNDVIPAGGCSAFTVGANVDLAAITASGSTSLNLSGGTGLATCGGGGGSGGGASVPTGSAGSPNAAVVSVQGIASGTAAPVSIASLPLPAGASTSAKQPTLDGDGGAPAHVTNFPATQPISAASLPNPTGAPTAANQTNGNQKTQIVDGSGAVIASTSNNLNVQCANCSGSGASAADAASFTAGTSVLAPGGVFFQTSPTSNPLTNGHQGMIQGTAQRAPFVNLRDSAGAEEGTSGNPLSTDDAGTQSAVNANAVPVPLPIVGNTTVTPTNCSGTITTGGTAKNAFAANSALHGFRIDNIDASAGSGEPLWISFTTTAAAATIQSFPLAAPATTTFAGAGSYSTPLGFGFAGALSVVAATSGHKYSCIFW